MKNTQAVLFDMDGVILDSEPLHTLARARFFAALGVPVSAEKEIVLGARKLDYWTDFKSRYHLPESPKELVDGEFREILKLIKEKKLPESKNLSALLGFLDKNGISVAVGSASSREYVSGVLDYLGIAGYFGTIVCGDEVQNPKPAPDTYLIAAQRLGAERGAVLLWRIPERAVLRRPPQRFRASGTAVPKPRQTAIFPYVSTS